MDAIGSQRTLEGISYLWAICRGFLRVWRVEGIGLGTLRWPDRSLYARKVEKDDEARSAALSLLSKGMITPGQAADLAGVSRQLVRYWLKHACIDWRRAWARRQAGMWRREIAALNGKVLRPPTKRQLRRQADKAYRDFNDTKRAKAGGTGASGPAK